MAASNSNGGGPTDSPMGSSQDKSPAAASFHWKSWSGTRNLDIPDLRQEERYNAIGLHLVEDLRPSTVQEAVEGAEHTVQVELGYTFKNPLDLRYWSHFKNKTGLGVLGQKKGATDQIKPTYIGRISFSIRIRKGRPLKEVLPGITRQLLNGVAEHLGRHDVIDRCAYHLCLPYSAEDTHASFTKEGRPKYWHGDWGNPGIWFLNLVEAAPKAETGLYDTIAGGRYVDRDATDELFFSNCWICRRAMVLFIGYIVVICGHCTEPKAPVPLDLPRTAPTTV